ncbi:MAG: N-acetylneuraminate synthase family protein [Chloroflexi bacterium]|nr:N-acetylneuraminate synthase family protein [Chloroflexota bacterium]
MKNSNLVYVIAEVGINHCGKLDRARELIDVAVDAGADAVKFQTFKTEKLVRRNTPKMPYQVASDMDHQSQFDMLKMVELNRDQHVELIEYCRGKRIDFISTPYDKESASLLAELGVNAIIKASKTHGVPTLFLQATWDTYSNRGRFPFKPDYMGVWGVPVCLLG